MTQSTGPGRPLPGDDVTLRSIDVGADRVAVGDHPGAGVPVLFVHPGITDSRVWAPVLAGLPGRRLITVDQRGYGASPPPTENYELPADLIRVLEACAPRGAHLVGNSVGGGTALAVALERPDLVHSLVLLAPAVPGAPVTDDPEWERRWERVEASGDPDALLEFDLDLWCAAGREPDVVELVRDAIAQERAVEPYRQPLPMLFDRLDRLSTATTLLVGDRDYVATVATAELAAARIPGCRLVRLPGVDHLPSLRAPDAVISAIREHLG